MATESYPQIRTWIDNIFKSNGRKFITGPHANEGLKKVLAKAEELYNSLGQSLGIATLDADGKLTASQLPLIVTNDKGWFATEAALIAAHTPGQNGWFATVGETDTVWVWDADTTAWVNTGSQGATVSGTYSLIITTAPTYNPDGTVKILNQSYVSDPTKYYEQRFEYTSGLVSKIEIKDDIAGKWVRHTNIYNGSGQLQAPTITDISAWTIV